MLEYYIPFKKALSYSLKVHTLKKFAATLCAVKFLSIFLAVLRAAQHGPYTSNLLPKPMTILQCKPSDPGLIPPSSATYSSQPLKLDHHNMY